MIFDTAAQSGIMQNSTMAKKDYSEIVIEWLASAMDASKVSQSELGRRTKSLDQPKISQVMRHKRELSAAELLEIANALNVELPQIDGSPSQVILPGHLDVPATSDDFSELAVNAIKSIASEKFHGQVTDEEIIEATAIILAALMQTGRWNPEIFDAAAEVVSKISNSRNEGEYSFKDYVKSVAISYVKMVGASEFL